MIMDDAILDDTLIHTYVYYDTHRYGDNHDS